MDWGVGGKGIVSLNLGAKAPGVVKGEGGLEHGSSNSPLITTGVAE